MKLLAFNAPVLELDKEDRARSFAAQREQIRDANDHSKQPVAVLSSGHSMPLLGFGTWAKGDGARRGETREAVLSAILSGYRHIDCASYYDNEGEVGDAITAAIAAGVVRREDLFVTTKLWNTDHAPPRVRASCLRSMDRLGVVYLDLFLIHWPVTGNTGPSVEPPIQDTWQAMEGLVREGLVRSIGVSNFSARKLERLAGYATIAPAVCQVEMHPYFRNDALLAWCQSRGIHVTAYSPLGSQDSETLLKRTPGGPRLLQDVAVQETASEVGATPAQVLIAWALQRGTSVLPKSSNPGRIAANFRALDVQLPQDAMNRLSLLPYQRRMVDGAAFLNPNGPYRTLAELWDDGE